MPSSNHPAGQRLVAAIDCRWRLVLERRPPELERAEFGDFFADGRANVELSKTLGQV
jgi:hypothetical protein